MGQEPLAEALAAQCGQRESPFADVIPVGGTMTAAAWRPCLEGPHD
jgi:hypothetical protein